MFRSPLKQTSMPSTVVGTCYDLLDLAIRAGVRDFTEGLYAGNEETPYEVAQLNQADHLLNLVGCQAGSRLLDIGCGYGRILEVAGQRCAAAKGITVSPIQVGRCRAKGLDVWFVDYRNIPPEW